MNFVTFDGTGDTYRTFIRNFEAAFDFNRLPDDRKGQFLISQLRGKAQEAVTIIKESQPSYERVKKVLDLLFLKEKDATTRLMELNNMDSSKYTDAAQYAHDLTVKVAEAMPGLSEQDLDDNVKTRFLMGLPAELQSRYDIRLYKNCSDLVQSVMQGEELAKSRKTSAQTSSVGLGATVEEKPPDTTPLVKPVVEPPPAVATILPPVIAVKTATTVDNTVLNVLSQQIDRGFDTLSRDFNNRRPTSPFRPTSSLSDMSAWSNRTRSSYKSPGRYDFDRPPTRSDYGRSPSRSDYYDRGRNDYYDRGRSPGRDYGWSKYNSGDRNYRGQSPGRSGDIQSSRPSSGGPSMSSLSDRAGPNLSSAGKPDAPRGERSTTDGKGRPPPGYKGGYKGKNFNENIWAADILKRADKAKNAKSQQGTAPPPGSGPATANPLNRQGGTQDQAPSPPKSANR
jgi:hypothetical protein